MLAELARQVGLALHNMQLDSALQESLASCSAGPTSCGRRAPGSWPPADAERRKIERNLHDGAQQHLVALAVTVRLARQVAATDPERPSSCSTSSGVDLQDAVQELRDLAHGIYPPVLMDRGLGPALESASTRPPARSDVTGRGGPLSPRRSRPPSTSAASRPCRTRPSTPARPRGDRHDRRRRRRRDLPFEVADDGVGFDPAGPARAGHGFVNMSDRLGAIGGTVEVRLAPGRGDPRLGRSRSTPGAGRPGGGSGGGPRGAARWSRRTAGPKSSLWT